MPQNKDGFDLVTSQYLFPYAKTEDELLKMCKAAFSALKSGGSYVGVTTWLDSDNPPKAQSAILGKGPYFNYASTFLTVFYQLSNLTSMFTKLAF